MKTIHWFPLIRLMVFSLLGLVLVVGASLIEAQDMTVYDNILY